MKRSRGETVFQVFLVLLMLLIFAVVALPILNIVSISLSESDAILSNSVGLYPKGFYTLAYREILTGSAFLRSLANTVGVTAVGTALSLMVIVLVAYALSKDFFGKKAATYFFVLTMYFSGGLIPTYLLIANYLGMRNTYFAYILPALVNVFYIIVVRSQVEALPASLVEAATIDGAGEFTIAFRIVIPTISPTIAAVSMFIALAKWNMWFPVMLYSNKESLWTLQYYLRAVVFDRFLVYSEMISSEGKPIPAQNYQMAAIVLVALPIVCIYPFVQKYFVKGILTGSVKG
jgi:putative aldouronate transport system permease protein